jgi:hypothetical protein
MSTAGFRRSYADDLTLADRVFEGISTQACIETFSMHRLIGRLQDDSSRFIPFML